MPEQQTQMRGRYDHKMDPKFRVSVPVEWRPGQGGSLWLYSSKRQGLPVIQALTAAEYEKRLADVDNHATATPEQKRALKGRLLTYCRKADVNIQGKLLVPKDWSEAAGLPPDDYVVLAGKGTYFEIWNTQNLKEAEALEEAELADLSKELGIY